MQVPTAWPRAVTAAPGAGAVMGTVMAHAAAVTQAADAEGMYRHLGEAARCIGFDKFMLGLEIHRPGEAPMLHIASGWPEAWQQRYLEKQYFRVDPLVRLCRAQAAPVLWSPELYTGRAVELLEDARGHGVGHGLSVPVHESSRIKSVLSLAREERIDATAAELRQLTDAAVVLAHCAHVASARLVVPELFRRLQPELSARERQVLEYLVKGKSNSMIGDILGRSEATIEFHVRHIFDKMGVSNRLQAAIRALSLGLVEL